MNSSHERFDMGSGQTINTAQAKKGWFISTCVGVILVVLVCAVIAAVGLIVYFAVPPKAQSCVCNCGGSSGGQGATTLTPEMQWQQCQDLATDRNECACPTTTSVMTSQTPTTPAPTEAPRILNNRLNKTITPLHYDIELQPYIYDGEQTFGFDGSVVIHMRCDDVTNMVVFHADSLTVNESSIALMPVGGSQISIESWSYDIDRHHFKLYLASSMVAGTEYTLAMSFNGTLKHSDLSGFYLSSYKPLAEPNTTRYLATTQFEEVGARRAFPCFDEPALKATFNVTLVRKQGWSSISNMNILYSVNRTDGWVADVYNKTVVQSTYTLAFVVCDFTYRDNVTARGTKFRIWTRPDYINYIDYALQISGPMLEWFEDYFNITYPLPYTDQIVIPNFRAGAMENFGLITNRDSSILFNNKYCTSSDRLRIAQVNSHEFAHQWFGNLVTMEWWDDIWLNEGFATYFETPCVDAIEPTWKMNQISQRVVQSIMRRDGGNSQPVFVKDIDHHSEIGKAFASTTYSKGGSVIRMLKYFLGGATFQKAMQRYLGHNAYDNTRHPDLYRVLEEQAAEDNVISWDTKMANITTIMDTWIEQQGYPLVTVTNNYNGKVTLKQEHFLYDQNITLRDPSPFGSYKWNIPIMYKTAAMNNGSVWLYMGEKEVTKDLADLPTAQNSWLMVNVEQQGYYRVMYNQQNWDAILQQLSADHTVFSVENRAQVVDDAFQLARGGYLSEVEALRTTVYLGNEREYMPWYATNIGKAYIDLMLKRTTLYGDYSKYMLTIVKPGYDAIGWDDSNGSEHLEKYLRIILLQEACKQRHKPCLDESVLQFANYMNNAANNPISTNLRRVVYCNAIRNGGAAEWQFMFDEYKALGSSLDYFAYERGAQGEGLGCTRESFLLRTYMEYGYNDNADVIMQRVARNEAGWRIVWDFADENIGNDGKSTAFWANTLNALTESLNTQYDKQMLETFAEKHKGQGLDNTFTSLINRVQTNIDWMTTNLEPIRSFLQAQTLVTAFSAKRAKSYSHSELRSHRGDIDITVPNEVDFDMTDGAWKRELSYEQNSRLL